MEFCAIAAIACAHLSIIIYILLTQFLVPSSDNYPPRDHVSLPREDHTGGKAIPNSWFGLGYIIYHIFFGTFGVSVAYLVYSIT